MAVRVSVPVVPGPDPADLLRDVRDYLARLGKWGADRDWFIRQIEYLGYPPERVGAAIALLSSEGRLRQRVDEDGVIAVWSRRRT